MSEYAIEKRSTEPKNFFAGEFPTVTESGTAGAALKEYAPVVINEDGNVVEAAAATLDNVVGITAASAESGAPCVYYMTGEYFADAINLPADVTIATLKPALRKINIYLR